MYRIAYAAPGCATPYYTHCTFHTRAGADAFDAVLRRDRDFARNFGKRIGLVREKARG